MFKKKNKPIDVQPTIKGELGGVLAVWGSPGSGKTTTAVKLAKYLASKNQNCILVLCDATAPMLPCICPPGEISEEYSLGEVLAAPHVNATLVKSHIVTLKSHNHLALLAMKKGENEDTYAPYSQVQAKELIACLRDIAPFVIIDCTSYIASDILTATSLLEADTVLRTANCDLKSVSYMTSQLQRLTGGRWAVEKQYKIATNLKPQQAEGQIEKALGVVDYKLHYSKELEEQFFAGNLLGDLSLSDSKLFRKEIQNIAKEVFEI